MIVSFSNIDLHMLYIKDLDYYSSRMFISWNISQSLFKLKLMKDFVFNLLANPMTHKYFYSNAIQNCITLLFPQNTHLSLVTNTRTSNNGCVYCSGDRIIQG